MQSYSLFPATSIRRECILQVLRSRFPHLSSDSLESCDLDMLSRLDPMLTSAKSLRQWLMGVLLDLHSEPLPPSRSPAPENFIALVDDPSHPTVIEEIEWWLLRVKHHSYHSALALQLTILLRKLKDAGLETHCSQIPLGDKSSFNAFSSAFATHIHSQLGLKIAPGKRMDIYAECLGFASGFQQLKPRLLQEPKTRLLSLYLRKLINNDEKTWPEVEENTEPYALTTAAAISLYRDWFVTGVQSVVDAKDLLSASYAQLSMIRRAHNIVAHLFVLMNQQPGTELKRPVASHGAIWFAAKHVCRAMNFDDDNGVSDLMNAYSPGDDGYELARNLERSCSWDISRDDIDSLDEMESNVDIRTQAAARLWEESGAFQPPLPIGTQLNRGVVAEICYFTPCAYLVKEHGHSDEERGHRRLVIRFEDAEVAQSTAQKT